jgi:enhancing lycopene biosynthesis protein 2
MKNIGVVLSGYGVQEGSEIQEATLTLYFLDKSGDKIHCFAPQVAQWHTIDHWSGKIQENEHRQVLVESAGSDPSTAQVLEKMMGAKHIVSKVDEIVYDSEQKIVSTAAYMLGPTISKIALGIEKLFLKIMEAE